MATATETLRRPRRKKVPPNFLPDYQQFPCPFQDLSCVNAAKDRWYFYSGAYSESDGCVIVDSPGDILFLQKWGFFGSQYEYEEGGCFTATKEQSAPSLGQVSNNVHRLLNAENERDCVETSGGPCNVYNHTLEMDCVSSENTVKIVTCARACSESKRQRFTCKDATEPTATVSLKKILQLTLEEAFFLSYALGCLIVTCASTKKEMTIYDMWDAYQRKQPTFLTKYAAYHHFRSKGWVPTAADNFGADYALYMKGMPFYHSSYLVFLKTVPCIKSQCMRGVDSHSWSWKSLMGLTRVCEQVSKDTLLLFIHHPEMTDLELRDPGCIRRLQVQEMIIRRWIPKKQN